MNIVTNLRKSERKLRDRKSEEVSSHSCLLYTDLTIPSYSPGSLVGPRRNV